MRRRKRAALAMLAAASVTACALYSVPSSSRARTTRLAPPRSTPVLLEDQVERHPGRGLPPPHPQRASGATRPAAIIARRGRFEGPRAGRPVVRAARARSHDDDALVIAGTTAAGAGLGAALGGKKGALIGAVLGGLSGAILSRDDDRDAQDLSQ